MVRIRDPTGDLAQAGSLFYCTNSCKSLNIKSEAGYNSTHAMVRKSSASASELIDGGRIFWLNGMGNNQEQSRWKKSTSTEASALLRLTASPVRTLFPQIIVRSYHRRSLRFYIQGIFRIGHRGSEHRSRLSTSSTDSSLDRWIGSSSSISMTSFSRHGANRSCHNRLRVA